MLVVKCRLTLDIMKFRVIFTIIFWKRSFCSFYISNKFKSLRLIHLIPLEIYFPAQLKKTNCHSQWTLSISSNEGIAAIKRKYDNCPQKTIRTKVVTIF